MSSISCRTLARFFKIVLSSTTKIYFFLPFISRIMVSISCRTVAPLCISCSLLHYEDLLLSSMYYASHEVYLLYYSCNVCIILFFPLLQRFTSFFYLYRVSLGLFLVELLLYFYKILHSSALKLYFLLPFVSRPKMSISNRTVANYYRIVVSSALKLYFVFPFVSRLNRSISCRNVTNLLLNLFFQSCKALLPSSICFTPEDVYFL